MNKYLLEILKESNTIIIPGLGALTITDKEKGEIMFMSYLKHDDGKLSGYIADKDGIDEADAKNLVAKYVREIQTSLDKGDSFDMFEFGTFTKNAGGDIEFTSWQGKSTKEPTPVVKAGAPKKEVKEEEKVATPKTEDKKPVAEKKKAVVKKEAPVIVPIVKKEGTKKAEPKVEAKKTPEKKATPKVAAEVPKVTEKKVIPIVPIKEPIKQVKKTIEEVKKPIVNAKIETKETVREPTVKVVKPAAIKEKVKKEKKKRGAGFWILMIVLALLIGGGTFFGLNYDQYKQYVPFLADEESKEDKSGALDKMKETIGDDEINDPDEVIDPDEIIDGSENPEEPSNGIDESEPTVEEPPVETPPSPVISSAAGPYHVIAGAFSSRANADRLANKLQDAGLPSSVIMNGGMHTVSMKSFASISDANASLTEMKGHSSGAWVLYKQ